jgi:Homeodomain-like domain
MNKQHVVVLTRAERQRVRALIAAGVGPARQLARARVLLKVDAGQDGPRWTDAEAAAAVEVSPRTVARVRAEWILGGVDGVLARQPPDRVYARKLDGAAEATLVAVACSARPDGGAHWSVRLLADRLVELGVVESIAPETVRQTLKKTSSSRG